MQCVPRQSLGTREPGGGHGAAQMGGAEGTKGTSRTAGLTGWLRAATELEPRLEA